MTAVFLVATFLAAFSEDPGCAGAQPQLQAVAEALDAKGIPRAEKLLEPLRDEYSKCPRVMVAIGRLNLANGEYRRANTYSELAMLDGSDDAEVLLFRGEILAMKGQSPQAQELLEKACKADPNNAEAHFQIGVIFDGSKRNPQAVMEFEKVTQLRPRDPRAWDYLALNLEPLGEIARAEAAYKKGIQVNEGTRFDRFLDYNYGKFLLKLNRLTESKLYLDRAQGATPQVRAVQYDHAKLNLRLGKLEEARQDAERALSIADPNGFILDLQVYNLLATICTRLGDNESAQKYIRLAESTNVPLRSRDRK